MPDTVANGNYLLPFVRPATTLNFSSSVQGQFAYGSASSQENAPRELAPPTRGPYATVQPELIQHLSREAVTASSAQAQGQVAYASASKLEKTQRSATSPIRGHYSVGKSGQLISHPLPSPQQLQLQQTDARLQAAMQTQNQKVALARQPDDQSSSRSFQLLTSQQQWAHSTQPRTPTPPKFQQLQQAVDQRLQTQKQLSSSSTMPWTASEGKVATANHSIGSHAFASLGGPLKEESTPPIYPHRSSVSKQFLGENNQRLMNAGLPRESPLQSFGRTSTPPRASSPVNSDGILTEAANAGAATALKPGFVSQGGNSINSSYQQHMRQTSAVSSTSTSTAKALPGISNSLKKKSLPPFYWVPTVESIPEFEVSGAAGEIVRKTGDYEDRGSALPIAGALKMDRGGLYIWTLQIVRQNPDRPQVQFGIHGLAHARPWRLVNSSRCSRSRDDGPWLSRPNGDLCIKEGDYIHCEVDLRGLHGPLGSFSFAVNGGQFETVFEDIPLSDGPLQPVVAMGGGGTICRVCGH